MFLICVKINSNLVRQFCHWKKKLKAPHAGGERESGSKGKKKRKQKMFRIEISIVIKINTKF